MPLPPLVTRAVHSGRSLGVAPTRSAALRAKVMTALITFATLAMPAGLLVVYLKPVRPQTLRWGATNEEVARPLPGDDEVRPGVRVVRTGLYVIEVDSLNSIDEAGEFNNTRRVLLVGTDDEDAE